MDDIDLAIIELELLLERYRQPTNQRAAEAEPDVWALLDARAATAKAEGTEP